VFCTKCGQALPDTANFCLQCGQPQTKFSKNRRAQAPDVAGLALLVTASLLIPFIGFLLLVYFDIIHPTLALLSQIVGMWEFLVAFLAGALMSLGLGYTAKARVDNVLHPANPKSKIQNPKSD